MSAKQTRISKRASARIWQFSLKTFLVVVTVLAGVCGYVSKVLLRVRQQRQIVAEIEKLGGSVAFDYQHVGEDVPADSPPGPQFVRSIFGDDVFADVDTVFVGFCLPTGRANTSLTGGARNWENRDYELLTKLPKVTALNVLNPGVDDDGIGAIAKIHALRRLLLKDPKVSGGGLAELRNASRLDSLILEGANVTDETICRINELSQLRTLRLHRTNVSSRGLKPLVELEQLRSLDLFVPSRIDDESLAYISQSPNLESLSLIGATITDAGAIDLPRLQSLKELTLYGASITDFGLERLTDLPLLRKLNLAHTKITDAGLARLTKLSALEELYLFGTSISDAGAPYIAQLKKLRVLRTEDTNVTEAGLFLLKGHSHLVTLSVGPDVPASAIQRLRSMLPNCDVEYRQTIFRPEPDDR
jgi:hypothetical protein